MVQGPLARCYLHLGGADGGGKASKETNLEHLLVMIEGIKWNFGASAPTVVHGCRHSAGTDQMMHPTRTPENVGR